MKMNKKLLSGFVSLLIVCSFFISCKNDNSMQEQIKFEEAKDTLTVSRFNDLIASDDYYFESLKWGEKGEDYGSSQHTIKVPGNVILGEICVDDQSIGYDAAWDIVQSALKLVVEDYDYSFSVIIVALLTKDKIVVNNVSYNILDDNTFYYNSEFVNIDDLTVPYRMVKKGNRPICSGYYLESTEKGIPGEYKKYTENP
ncbi:MAG: hypothetical protein KAH01_02415 [Caldisericia bacterium]|nr:hypothetical protein [Caldisericia bacterium]